MFRALPRLLILAIGAFALAVFVAEEFLQQDGDSEDGDDGEDDQEPADPASLVDTAAGAGPWGTFHVAVKTAGLVETLEGEGPFTVFAPTDDAFGELGETLDELLAQPDELARILKHHTVEGSYWIEDLAGETSLTTLAGTKLTFVSEEEELTVSGANLVEANVTASNGILHGIDQVLMPPKTTTKKKKSTKKTT